MAVGFVENLIPESRQSGVKLSFATIEGPTDENSILRSFAFSDYSDRLLEESSTCILANGEEGLDPSFLAKINKSGIPALLDAIKDASSLKKARDDVRKMLKEIASPCTPS